MHTNTDTTAPANTQQAADKALGTLAEAYVAASDAEAMASAAYHAAMRVASPYRSEAAIDMARVALYAASAYYRAVTAAYRSQP
jgi:hypothetical protein